MILIVFAHPYPSRSNANIPLLNSVSDLDNVVVSDLYEKYPDFHISVKTEQQLLEQAKLIVFQFPFYWYNVPALLKQWQESVLTRGFAFGKTDADRELRGKPCMAVVTTGHEGLSYQSNGYDCHTMEEFLRPLEQMALHCKMQYQPPIILHQAHRAKHEELLSTGQVYRQRILDLYQHAGSLNE